MSRPVHRPSALGKLVLATAFVALLVTSRAEEKVTRVHWIYSSWAAVHSVPAQCTQWLGMQPGIGKVEFTEDKLWPVHEMLDANSKRLHFYNSTERKAPGYNQQKTHAAFLARVQARQYDILAVCLALDYIADDDSEPALKQMLDFLAAEARKRQARFILAPVGRDFGPASARGLERLHRLAQPCGAVICPWWSAMKKVSAERPDVVLLGDVVKHHAGLGCVYLCCSLFLHAATDQPPEKLNFPGHIFNRLPSDEPIPVSAADATYFQTIAWKEWQTSQSPKQ